jgi:hypothetical protein
VRMDQNGSAKTETADKIEECTDLGLVTPHKTGAESSIIGGSLAMVLSSRKAVSGMHNTFFDIDYL